MAAIQDAKSHMGDFKLKSASDYVVAQRVNTKLTTEKVIMHKLYVSCLLKVFIIFTGERVMLKASFLCKQLDECGQRFVKCFCILYKYTYT